MPVVFVTFQIISCLQSWKHIGIKRFKVAEAQTSDTAASAHLQAPAAALLHGQHLKSWACNQWGLVTTAAVLPGDVLLTVPRRHVVVTKQPDQALLQLAGLAYSHAADWYSHTVCYRHHVKASSQQAEAQPAEPKAPATAPAPAPAPAPTPAHAEGQAWQQGADAIAAHEVQARASSGADGSEDAALAELVAAWLQPGRLVPGLSERLCMAQLWLEHDTSDSGRQCMQALAGTAVCYSAAPCCVYIVITHGSNMRNVGSGS